MSDAAWSAESPRTWKGQGLGLPPSGRGSLGAIGRRFAGAFLDGLILAPVAILSLAFGSLHFVPLLASALYTVPLIARGQTLGQKALKLRVVALNDVTQGADAPPPGLDVSVRRFLLPGGVGLIANFRGIAPAAAMLVQIAALLNYLWALWDPNRQCLHDKIADVVVLATEGEMRTPPAWPPDQSPPQWPRQP